MMVIIWRPLEPTAKTALVLYLIFAGLLTAVTFWMPVFRTTIGQVNGNNLSVAISGTNELGLKQQELKKTWRQMLVNDGYIPQGIYKVHTEHLNERQEGTEKFNGSVPKVP